MSITIIVIILIALALLVAGGLLFFKKRSFKKLIKSSFKSSLFLIKIPSFDPKSEESKKPLKEKIAVAEQFIASLSGLEKPIILEIAQENIGSEVQFYLATSTESADFIENQLVGLYPGISVEKVEDYNIFNPSGVAKAVFLKQKENWAMPIKTYSELGADTIAPILSSFSKIKQDGEGLVFQIVISPAPKTIKGQLEDIISKLRKGESMGDVLGGKTSSKILAESFKLAISPTSEKDEKKEKSPIDDEAIKSIQFKSSKPLFSVNLRAISSAKTKERADDIISTFLGSFQQFGSPTKNSFIGIKPSRIKKFIFNYVFRLFNDKQQNILNAEEIASFWHFPVAQEASPQAQWSKFKQSAPPVELPTQGVILGESVFRGERKTIYMEKSDRRRHFYIIGQTGTGKSYMATNMAIHDIKNGDGVGIIDPHGDLVDDILGYIPDERRDDVIVFNPGDLERPLGLNMLEYDYNRPEQKTFIINELINIFDKLYDLKATGGPMFEQYLRNALGLIMADKDDPATLLDVQRVFTNDDYREAKLRKCPDPTVVEFWKKEAAKITSGEQSLQNITPYITSKFNTFVSNDYMRPIIAQKKSAFNFREVMDNKKILLINLSKGRIGDINASLLGLICVGRLQIAALSRTDTPEDERNDFYLYIDEFQNFSTPSISVILSEARKYRLCLILAHQFIAQLDDKIREAVFGNVGTMSSFRVGSKDAEFLENHFAPVFSKQDLMNLDNFNAVIRMLAKNQPIRPFSFQTMVRESGNPAIAQEMKEMSRQRYGANRQDIEKMIRERYLS